MHGFKDIKYSRIIVEECNPDKTHHICSHNRALVDHWFESFLVWKSLEDATIFIHVQFSHYFKNKSSLTVTKHKDNATKPEDKSKRVQYFPKRCLSCVLHGSLDNNGTTQIFLSSTSENISFSDRSLLRLNQGGYWSGKSQGNLMFVRR